ncbi:hypothetical protein QTO34_016895, partial [Cnephaeus nilssonii]
MIHQEKLYLPLPRFFHPHCNQTISQGVQRKRKKKDHSTSTLLQAPKLITVNRSEKQMEEEDSKHTDAIMKVAFLKKCKEAGLLNDLFEEILQKLHLIQERLMEENISESDYEEIGTSLFDCRLFEDAFVSFQKALETNIQQFEEKWQQMKQEIELLQDLKQTLCSVQENRPRSAVTNLLDLTGHQWSTDHQLATTDLEKIAESRNLKLGKQVAT